MFKSERRGTTSGRHTNRVSCTRCQNSHSSTLQSSETDEKLHLSRCCATKHTIDRLCTANWRLAPSVLMICHCSSSNCNPRRSRRNLSHSLQTTRSRVANCTSRCCSQCASGSYWHWCTTRGSRALCRDGPRDRRWGASRHPRAAGTPRAPRAHGAHAAETRHPTCRDDAHHSQQQQASLGTHTAASCELSCSFRVQTQSLSNSIYRWTDTDIIIRFLRTSNQRNSTV